MVLFMHATKHSWMTLCISRPLFCRQLFAGHGGGLSANEKEEQFAWKSYSFCFFFRISNQALLSQMKHLKN